ncbi:MAG: isoleucine--tRNA ligase, partial [Planctomycetes bacterium]|nr:isoleucine--tRNA ligase [Planctomycetota bacterium]
LQDDFVSTDNGTGIVHMAPAYGEDDYRICLDAGIQLIDPLNDEAQFTAQVPDYKGQFCKEADKAIIKRLKEEGKLVQQSTITHSYPFCERTETPLIYRAIDAWYVKVEDMNDRLVELNDTINWVPKHVGEGRFGNWLKGAKDWNISRNRFWGSCMPVWINVDDATDCICIGSIDELFELSGQKVDDLHKHTLDEVIIQKDGKTYKRTPEVLDCWFESGSMPFAQKHFPYGEGHDEKDPSSFLPANFIAEGLDQTRGWFYTLLILSTTLFDKPTFQNVVVNGMILAEDGQKMSKRKKNYPDPNLVLEEYGADALRAYMINSPVVRGEPLKFSEKGLKDIIRTVIIPYWSTLSFFTTYAETDSFDPRSWDAPAYADRPDLDRWILSVLQSLVRDIDIEMEGYRLYNVVPRLVSFIDDLTNWYVRSSRRRFWKSEDDSDKSAAFFTLYEVLHTFAKLLAPFMPFITEEVYQILVKTVEPDAATSIHWCDYPEVETSLIDEELESRMSIIRRATSLGRKLREDHKLKVRQPLALLTLVHRDEAVRAAVDFGSSRLQSELNVKAVSYESNESNFCSVSVKPNFKVLKERCPQKLGAIGKELKSWGFDEVSKLEAGDSIDCAGEALSMNDVMLQRKAIEGAVVATDGELTVVLDTQLTDELILDGLAREFTSVLQNARKEHGFEVSDRICVTWNTEDELLKDAVEKYKDRIANEILATDFEWSTEAQKDSADINGHAISFDLKKT